jgi:hypothetical protein
MRFEADLRFQDWAIWMIPAGEGLGGLNARVMMGWNLESGRKVVRRCSIGKLSFSQPRSHWKHRIFLLEVPCTYSFLYPALVKIAH